MSLLFSFSVERNALVKNGHARTGLCARRSEREGKEIWARPSRFLRARNPLSLAFRTPATQATREPGLGARQERSPLLLLLVALRLAGYYFWRVFTLKGSLFSRLAKNREMISSLLGNR